jgi:hypothetical protein
MSEADLLTPALKKKRGSRRRWLLVVVLVLLPILLLTGIYLTSDYLAELDLRQALAAVDRIDPNWRFDDLEASRAAYPDDDNSALQVSRSVELISPRWATTPALVELPLDLRNPYQLEAGQRAALRAEMAKATAARVEARKLADMPHGRFPFPFVPPLSPLASRSADASGVASLLWYDTVLRSQEGDADGALRSIRAILNAERSVGDEPSLFSLTIRSACRGQALHSLERVLSQAEPSPTELAQVQSLLERNEADNLLLPGLRGERASFDRLLEELQNGTLRTQDVLGPAGPGGLSRSDAFAGAAMTAVPGSIKYQRAFALRYFTALAAIAESGPGQQAEFDRIDADWRHQGLLVRYLLPAVATMMEANRRTITQTRCALVGVASERYRRAHGDWPASLDQLVADGLLTQMPTAPHDGAPLCYRVHDDRVVIYSNAMALEDNGGTLHPRNVFPKGTALGFTLWHVSQRRRLPLPAAEPPAPLPGQPGEDVDPGASTPHAAKEVDK